MNKHIKIYSFADVDRSGKVRWTANELGYICGDFTIADICAACVLRMGVEADLLPLEGNLEYVIMA